MSAKTTPPSGVTKKDLGTLRHMLGIETPEKATPAPYRNYYCATPGDAHMTHLANLGMVEMYAKTTAGQGGNYEWFRCTDAGRAAAMKSFASIRYSKAARRYVRYLQISDAYSDLTFHQFLTSPEFAEARREA